MIVQLLTERHLEVLSLTGGCRGPSQSTLVKMSNSWKSHAAAVDIFDSIAAISVWRLSAKYSPFTSQYC